MDLGLRDRTVFVAGSSRGIGFSIAESFLDEGARVVVTGRARESLDRAGAALGEGRSDCLLAVETDLTNEAEIERALDSTREAFGPVDIVVANVGDGRGTSGWDVGRDEWDVALERKLLGSLAVARWSMPDLIAKRGSLVMISSIAGTEGIRAPMAYAAAKAALNSAVGSLARSVGPQGVRVNAVVPGNVLFPGGTWETKVEQRPEFWRAYVEREVPLERFGRPEEIAQAVVFLASERASFITGAALVVDGGQTRSHG